MFNWMTVNINSWYYYIPLDTVKTHNNFIFKYQCLYQKLHLFQLFKFMIKASM